MAGLKAPGAIRPVIAPGGICPATVASQMRRTGEGPGRSAATAQSSDVPTRPSGGSVAAASARTTEAMRLQRTSQRRVSDTPTGPPKDRRQLARAADCRRVAELGRPGRSDRAGEGVVACAWRPFDGPPHPHRAHRHGHGSHAHRRASFPNEVVWPRVSARFRLSEPCSRTVPKGKGVWNARGSARFRSSRG